ncbi:MAG TPA: hypothetical protein PLJ21_06265 [Pseudobdellovibrionaceae bacterium]|nr:hypothetical protein [Pseudobdellovibrionaceae bacterium]
MNISDFLVLNLQESLIFFGIFIFIIAALAVLFKSFALALRYWWVAIPLFGAWSGGILGFFIGVALIVVLKLLFFILMLPFKLLSSEDSKPKDIKH